MHRIEPAAAAKLKTWFAGYVNRYKTGDKDRDLNILIKEQHTWNVCREIRNLSEALGVNENGRILAEITALFHDAGRFEQYTRYGTFLDRDSVNHARLAIDILKENRVLDDLEEDSRELICRVIGNHNTAFLPVDEDGSCLFFSRMLRDADKLDIWRVVTEYYHRKEGGKNQAVELNLPDTPGISAEVMGDLTERSIVKAEHIRNLNDFKLLQMGWVFDVNFGFTRREIKKRFYMERILEVLPDTEMIRSIAGVIREELNRRD